MELAHLVQARVVLTRLRRVALSPVLHFLVLGGLLVVADVAWSRLAAGPTRGDRTIVFTAADVRQLRRGFEQQYGTVPSATEQNVLVDRAVDDEILYRRALEIGLDRGNRVVRQRLVAIMRMLADDPKKDEDALYREAIALRLDRTDVVIRRHLVQLMTLLLKRSGQARPVTEADLDGALERDGDRYRLPAELTLTQVFLDPARRGPALQADAQRILAEVRSGRVAPEAAPGLGDPFLLGSRFTKRSAAEIRRLLGDSFASAVAQGAPGEWSGPVRSSYGLHLVLVEKRVPGRVPAVAQVRNQLVGRVLEERGDEALRVKLAEMRRQYVVRIDRAGEEPIATAKAAEGGMVLPVAPHARELGD